jgi:hypothetical protein
MGFWTWMRVGKTNRLLAEQNRRQLLPQEDSMYCRGSNKLADSGGLCPVCHVRFPKKRHGGMVPMHLTRSAVNPQEQS